VTRIGHYGLKFNDFFEKNMFVIIPSSMVAGFLFADHLASLTGWIAWLFAWITFVMALSCKVADLQTTFRRPTLMLIILLLAHLVAPWIVYKLGAFWFGAGSPYIIGMVLFAAIPLGVSSIIWVGLSNGNVALTLALVVIDTLFSPLILPAVLAQFFGARLDFEYWQLFRDLSLMIVLPTTFGVLVNHWTKGSFREKIHPYATPSTKLAFMLVVMINVAAITPFMSELRADLLKLVPVTLLVVVICYGLGFLACLLPGRRSQITTLPYLAGMRNISLGIVVGLQYFGPLAAVPVVLSILIQQPMATLNHWLLKKWLSKRK
jgi:BASS family bile acid:Na+ symporter